jgi:hypothetical protein
LEKSRRGATLRNQLTDDIRPCVKCGGRHTKVIGQSVSPSIFYVTCTDCGHSSAVPATPTRGVDAPDAHRMEGFVRGILADFDLPADVASVAKAAQGWQIVLRTKSHRIVRVHVLDAEPGAIRAALTRALANA